MSDKWAVPTVAAGAAIIGGLLAQWFRVWLDSRVLRLRLLAQLADDLQALVHTLRSMEECYVSTRQLQMQHFGKLDVLTKAYQSYEGQLTAIPGAVRATVSRAFRELAGVRETFREIEARNARATAGQGSAVPKDEVQSTYDMVPVLTEIAVTALAAVVVARSWRRSAPWGRLSQDRERDQARAHIRERFKVLKEIDPKRALEVERK